MEILSHIPLFGSLANAGMIIAGGLLGALIDETVNLDGFSSISAII